MRPTGGLLAIVLALVTAGLLAAVVGADANAARAKTTRAVVDRVIDGDTIVLRGGKRVRLVQIDTPERRGECYGRAAGRELRELLPRGTRVRLRTDPRLDKVDRYGRLLRYVFKGKTNINLKLVRQGAATVWFFNGDRGRYAKKLLKATKQARAKKRGMWRECRVEWHPNEAVTTRDKGGGGSPSNGGGGGNGSPNNGDGCHPSYKPCLPVVSDLDCGDIDDDKKPIRVVGDDPYRLDGSDNDGLGCER